MTQPQQYDTTAHTLSQTSIFHAGIAPGVMPDAGKAHKGVDDFSRRHVLGCVLPATNHYSTHLRKITIIVPTTMYTRPDNTKDQLFA